MSDDPVTESLLTNGHTKPTFMYLSDRQTYGARPLPCRRSWSRW